MEPNTGLVIAALVFLAVYVAVDRVAAVFLGRSRDAADVEKKKADVEMSKDLSEKLVQTMQTMSGQGVVNSAMRMASGVVINEDSTEGAANGRNASFSRDNSQHSRVPESYPQSRATTATGR